MESETAEEREGERRLCGARKSFRQREGCLRISVGPPVSMEEGRGVEVGNRRMVVKFGVVRWKRWKVGFGWWTRLRENGRKSKYCVTWFGSGPRRTDTRDISYLSPGENTSRMNENWYSMVNRL